MPVVTGFAFAYARADGFAVAWPLVSSATLSQGSRQSLFWHKFYAGLLVVIAGRTPSQRPAQQQGI
jgi:hypothetical protein